ncbi:MAG TPA: 50S ribosomal protein L35 [Dictyoglomaceae bacterium]|nr:50S ribosomal protein L35 [Dictyoglomaceae bacterium]HOL38910.1 50S ribosomal protein L35 [Dictyoglomaceae bacterium]HOP94902.1 50S ribosomal protein L35 [Dictyoglomaceae bacterium]HPP15673.1 50S ribosomal protein L35 [Dictyoglomaceae bacterium]HPU43389.1 50S ribosomal protein L35 [Dictyoglomaceae bacterium]
MSKLKTRSSAAKRFKITATGKILHKKAGKGHHLSIKSSSRKRRLSIPAEIKKVDRKKIEKTLPI